MAVLLPATLLGYSIWSNRRAIDASRSLAAKIHPGQPISEVVEELEGFDYDLLRLTDASRGLIDLGEGHRPRLSTVRAALKETPDGHLSIMVIGFGFLRHFVEVDFEDGRVVKVDTASLD